MRFNETLHNLNPTSSFEKLMVAEAVITDLGKTIKKQDQVIFGLKNELNSIKDKNKTLSEQTQSQLNSETKKKLKNKIDELKKEIHQLNFRLSKYIQS